MLALYAPAIFFDGLMQKSVLDVFFICAVAVAAQPHWSTQRARRRRDLWLLLGSAMGALSLTRENALVFVAVIVGVGAAAGARPDADAQSLARRDAGSVGRVRRSAWRSCCCRWPSRNYAVGGGFYLTTSQFGPNFFIGNNPRSDGTYMSLRFGRGAPEYERQDATELAEHALGRPLTPAEVSSYWTDRALDFITDAAGRLAAADGPQVLLLVERTEMLDTESQESYAEWSLAAARCAAGSATSACWCRWRCSARSLAWPRAPAAWRPLRDDARLRRQRRCCSMSSRATACRWCRC